MYVCCCKVAQIVMTSKKVCPFLSDQTPVISPWTQTLQTAT